MVPLEEAFDKMVVKEGIAPSLRKAFLEAFMAGAATYEIALTEALKSNDPEHVAAVQDAMALEIATRHRELSN